MKIFKPINVSDRTKQLLSKENKLNIQTNYKEIIYDYLKQELGTIYISLRPFVEVKLFKVTDNTYFRRINPLKFEKNIEVEFEVFENEEFLQFFSDKEIYDHYFKFIKDNKITLEICADWFNTFSFSIPADKNSVYADYISKRIDFDFSSEESKKRRFREIEKYINCKFLI